MDRLSHGQRAIDVGAAQGSLTKLMAEQVGETGRVWAIEPDATRAMNATQPWVSWHHVLAWHQPGRQMLFLDGLQSSCWPALLNASGGDTADVEALPLDAIVTEAVDLIKVDVQGAECHVLQGATRHLAECPIWVVEVWPYGLLEAGRSPQELYTRFATAGYTVQWAGDNNVPVLATEDEFDEWAQQAHHGHSGHINIVASRTP